MKRSSINIVLLAAVVLVFGLVLFIQRDYSRRNLEFAPGMFYSPAYEAGAANSVFSDSGAASTPVPGSVARGYAPLGYAATPEDAVRAGEELRAPTLAGAASEASAARGAELFTTYCAVCHGSGGAGDGPVVQRGFPPPPSLLAANALALKDGQIFHIISHGQRNMPSMASQVQRADRWHLVRHVRALQSRAAKPSGAETAAVPAQSPRPDTTTRRKP